MATKTQGLRIRTKLLTMILLLVFISICIGGASFYGLSRTIKQYQAHLVPALEAINGINTVTAKARRYEKEFFLFSSIGENPEYKKKQRGYYDKLVSTYDRIPPLLKQITVDEKDKFSNPDERLKMIDAINSSFIATQKTLQPLTGQMLAGKTFTESSELYGVYKKQVHDLEDGIEALRVHLSEALESQRLESASFEKEMLTGLLVLSCGMLIFGTMAGLLASKRITTPLNKLMEGIEAVGQGEIIEITVPSKDEFAEIARVFNETIKRIKVYIKTDEQRQKTEENVIKFLEVVSEASEGNLTLRAPVTEDAFGSIADAYNLMTESLAALLTQASINAEEVGEESRHMLEIFQKMKEGAETQLNHVTAATDAAEETAESATQIAEKTSLARLAADSVEEATTLGNERVNRNIEGMQLIRVTVQVINKKMKSLAERLLEIGTISQLISDVATRTTILAMNASIEASRAGQQGRGFLVISDEIKRLADEASEATKQIGGIIKAIQSEANDVTLALEEETSTVEEQTKIAQDTSEALKAIRQATNESNEVVTEITRLSQQQQQISDSMVATIHKMAALSAETSAMITESSAISEGLNGVSESLLQSLGQFRLSPSKDPVATIAADAQDIAKQAYLPAADKTDSVQEASTA